MSGKNTSCDEDELVECEGCGEEFEPSELRGDPPRCGECLINDSVCPKCGGCGEGMVDGSRCTMCGGSGQVTPSGWEDDFDPPDPDDDFDDRDYGPYGYSPD